MKYFCLLALVFFSINSFSQKKGASISQVILDHVDWFKSNTVNYDRVYLELKLQDTMQLPQNFILKGFDIDPSSINKKERNYLIQFRVSYKDGKQFINVVDFELVKHSKNHLGLINHYHEEYVIDNDIR